MKQKIKDDSFYIGLLIISIFVYFFCALLIPFNQAPDESMRFDVVRYLYTYGRLPHGGDEFIRNPVWGISYGFTPIFSYIISAIFVLPMKLLTDDIYTYIVAARMVSVFSSLGTVYFCIKIGRKLLGNEWAKVLAIGVAFWPQFIFVSSYVNNDAFAIFTVAWVIYGIVIGIEKRWNNKACIFLGCGCGLCALSYYNAYGIVLVAIIVAVIDVLFSNDIEKKWLFIIHKAGIVSLVAFGVAGWWFVRNAVLYQGDFLGLDTCRKYGEMYAVEEYKPSKRATPNNSGVSLFTMLFEMKWINISYESFLGKFGNMNVSLPQKCYSLLSYLLACGVLGNVFPYKKESGENNKKMRYLWGGMWLMIAITIAISVYYSYNNDFQPQGRYCLPMLISLLMIVMLGYKKISCCLPKNVKRYVPLILIVLFSLNMLWVLSEVFIVLYIE